MVKSDSTVSSDPNSSLRRDTTNNQKAKPSISEIIAATQQSSTPPSKTDSQQKSLVIDKTQMIREERRNRMRSMGVHVVGDNDDRTVYELPVVIKRTRSRRRVHKLKWKEGMTDPDAKSDTESTSDGSYQVMVSSYVPIDVSGMTPLQLTVLAMVVYSCLILSILYKLIDESLKKMVENRGEKKE